MRALVITLLVSFGSGLGPSLGSAAVLDLPFGAVLQEERVTEGADYVLPTGIYSDSELPHEIRSGNLRLQAWQMQGSELTTSQILAPLATQLDLQGYDTRFICADRACGGFDFRFAIDVLPAPGMFVDLGDFRFLSATREDTAITLLISRSAQSRFLQIATVTPSTSNPIVVESSKPALNVPEPNEDDLIEALQSKGRVVLGDLTFRTGSSQLGPGPFESLLRLSTYLKDNPTLRVALVGHTDSEGSLANNIALSKRRAGSVRSRLVQRYDVPSRQMEAEGMGYLSPIANNQSETGRQANRRVEVIITSTE